MYYSIAKYHFPGYGETSAADDPLVTQSVFTYRGLTPVLHRIIVSEKCLKCESASRHFKPREGPSRDLLRDCTTLPINRLQH